MRNKTAAKEKNNMKVIIINSAPGVGKSTLLRAIEACNLNNIAVIDGDDLGRIIPLNGSNEWLDLIQDNIAVCAKNYLIYGVKILFISFVFPSSDRITRLITLLNRANINDISHLTLISNDFEIEKRILNRNTSKLISVGRAKELNAMIKEMKSDFIIDTSEKSAQEVFQQMLTLLMQIEPGF